MQRKHMRKRVHFNSPAVLGFTGICLVAMLLSYITSGASTRAVFSVYRSSLLKPLTYIRMFTHVFGHADWNHLIGNIMYILILGPMLEEKYGTGSLIFLMAVTALFTGLFNFIFFPSIQLLGASGIVFALILLASFTGVDSDAIPFTFILVALLYIGQQLYQAFTVDSNISYTSHICGGIIGSILGFMMNSRKVRH